MAQPGVDEELRPVSAYKSLCFFYFITGITFENRVVALLHRQHGTRRLYSWRTKNVVPVCFRNPHGRFRNEYFIYFVFYVFYTDSVVWNLHLCPCSPICRTGQSQKHTRKPRHFPHVIWPLIHKSQHVFTKKWTVYMNYEISARIRDGKVGPRGKS